MRTVKLIGLLILFLVLQTSVLPSWVPLKYRPDLISILVICVAILKGSQGGAAFGLLGGVLEDFACGKSCGLLTLVKTSVGFLTGVIPSRVFPDYIFIPAFAVYLFSFLEQVFFYFLAFSVNAPPGPLPWKELLYPFAAINAALALPVNLLVRGILARQQEFR